MKRSVQYMAAIKDKVAEEEEELEVAENFFEENSDLCQILMERYGKSTAPQHRHLCASSTAMRAILQEEGLPLIPSAYFAATISSINDAADTLDSSATAALTSFLSILLPLVPSQSLPPSKAIDAVSVLVTLLQRPPEAVSTATVRSVIKSLGDLLKFCDLENWSAIKFPFEMILSFSIDKRPKVRRCAQVCVEKVFKSFQCSTVIKESSKVALSLFERYMPLANEISTGRIVDGSKSEMLLKYEHLEVLHMLNLLKLIVPYLSNKVGLKILPELYKTMTCECSPITRHILSILEVFFDPSKAELVSVPEAEKIVTSLVSYVSFGEKNPMDTVMSASILLKNGLAKLRAAELGIWCRNLPLVFGSIAGLLVSEANTSSQAAAILKELINHHMDRNIFMVGEIQVYDDKFMATAEARAIESTCAVFEHVLSSFNRVPNEHTLAVISDLFLKLGDVSYFFMKGILLKLADFMTRANGDMAETEHLQECIGSAIIAVGPEKMLTLVPISLHAEEFTCSNIWLLPILKKYVVGASLEYFLEHIVPLVESLQQASRKVKKSPLRKDLQTSIRGLWDLLPAFCRYPIDTHKYFESLAKLCTAFLQKDCFMHENIALGLQELVNQNKSILRNTDGANGFEKHSSTSSVTESNAQSRSVPSHYSRKIATRNIKAFASCSVDLLLALTDVFFRSPPEKRTYLKGAIGCLASITETSKIKKLFVSSLEKFQFINGVGLSEKMESCSSTSVDKEEEGYSKKEEQEEAQRCMLMEFASSLVEGANEDLIAIICDYIKPALQATDGIGQSEAYYTMGRIFEEHALLYSSRFDEMMDLLLGLKPPADISSLRSRFVCLHNLLVHILKSDLKEKNAKAFLVLNEIILALKDSKEEARKEAYDVLLKINCSLKDSSSANSDSLHQQLFSMIMAYLSGTPPPIMSGAIAALSLLIYKNNDSCFSVPELVPSVLVLLQSKAIEVIKAVLGFVKVLVSCLEAIDLQKLLPDIINGILPWSSVSRNHFRSKVTIILEIVIRKCGSASVEPLVPEKYRAFIKTVMEQRHGKMSSKEAETSDVMPKLAVSSRREATDTGIARTTQKDKKEKKRKFNMASTNEPHNSTKRSRSDIPAGQSAGQLRGNIKHTKMREFGKRPTTGRKEKMGWRKVSRSSKAPIHKPSSNSKFQKHGKVSSQKQRTSK